MFQRLQERARSIVERRAQERIETMTERSKEELPAGIGAEAAREGIWLSGRALRRRLLLEPTLRNLIAGILR